MISLQKTKKYFKMSVNKLSHKMRADFFATSGVFLPVPEKVYFTIANKCNYRCGMCSHWARGLNEMEDGYIGLPKIYEMIDDMAALGINELGISGGEPLLFADKVFATLEYANKKGLYTHFVTNGSLLTEEMFARYERIGGGHISLSLDAVGAKHDQLRGQTGAFDAVMRVIEIYKNGNFPNINLKLNTVLSNESLDDCLAVAQIAIDNNLLFFVQPFDVYDFANKYSLADRRRIFPLWVKEENFGKLRMVIDGLLELKNKHPQIVLNSVEHLQSFYNYFVNGNIRTKCFAGIDQLVVDCDGGITFCKYGKIGDLKTQTLKDFILSQKRKTVAVDSLQCQQGCLLGCMYRPNFFEMILNGPKQFSKLIKTNK